MQNFNKSSIDRIVVSLSQKLQSGCYVNEIRFLRTLTIAIVYYDVLSWAFLERVWWDALCDQYLFLLFTITIAFARTLWLCWATQPWTQGIVASSRQSCQVGDPPMLVCHCFHVQSKDKFWDTFNEIFPPTHPRASSSSSSFFHCQPTGLPQRGQ